MTGRQADGDLTAAAGSLFVSDPDRKGETAVANLKKLALWVVGRNREHLAGAYTNWHR